MHTIVDRREDDSKKLKVRIMRHHGVPKNREVVGIKVRDGREKINRS